MQLSCHHGLGALILLAACGPEPQLETFTFGASAPMVVPGGEVTLVATALDASGETVTVEAFVTPELTGRPHPIGRRTFVLQNGPSPQRGTLDWVLDESVFRFEGNSALHFEATLGDRTIGTALLQFQVVPRLDRIAVDFDSPFPGAGAPTVVPADGELSVTIEGEHLAGRRAVLFEVYNVGDGRRLDRQSLAPSADLTHVRYPIPPGVLGAQSSGVLRFEASIEGAPKLQTTITVQTEGVYGCGFFDSAGRILEDARLQQDVALELRVYTFGLDGRATTIDLVEDDDVDDDFYARFTTAVLDGIAKDQWTTEFIDDGLLDGVDEFKFHADLGQGLTCDSPILEVAQ